MDNLVYFLYASDINFQGQLSSEQTPANNGWPIFLGLIFSIVGSLGDASTKSSLFIYKLSDFFELDKTEIFSFLLVFLN